MLPQTSRLRLRPYVTEDFESLRVILTDPVTMQYYPRPYDEKGVRRWIQWSLDNYAQYGFGLWALEIKETGEFIGDCGLTLQRINGQTLPEIGYHIHRAHWRRGYASEAALAVRDWAFTHTDYPALYSYMNVENEGSWRTAEKIGMTRVETYEDEEERLHVYRITRKEWEAREKAL